MCSLNITLAEQRKHEAELLARLRACGRPITLPDLFRGARPRWATEAADRLEIAGKVTEDETGRLHVAAV
ncbi:unnamed protein product [Gemmataceae bacterium]|nr:unnamed protein product [Gemmataceae bacterium]VTT99064.1 unnamed protein product [Gemmataceae bacterium]